MSFRFLFVTLFLILTFSINAQTFALPAEVEELTDRWKKQELKDYLKAVLSNVIALQDAHNGEIEELIFAHDGEIDAMDKMLEAYLLQIRSLKQDSLLLDKQLGVLVDSIITLHNDYQQIGILRDSLENSMTLLVSANQTISLLSDSLALKDSLLKTLYNVDRVTSNDYLNQYAKTGVIPTEDVTLAFNFHHAVLINGGFIGGHSWNSPWPTVYYILKDSSLSSGYIPEFLGTNDIDIWLTSSDWPCSQVFDRTVRLERSPLRESLSYEYSSCINEKKSWKDFNDFFPKVKLTDGHFLSLKGGHLKEDVHRHFIVSSETVSNYGKLQYHWRWAEGNQLSENDFTLDIHEVEGEFYIILDVSQLKRFGFSIFPFFGDREISKTFAFTRAGTLEVISPFDLLFLFKLKEE